MTRWRRLGGVPLLLLAAATPAATPAADPARVILTPSLCPATPATLPFTPPLDQPLQLEVATTRPASHGPAAQFSMVYRLQFRAEGRGYRLTAVLARLGTGDTAAMHHSMAAILQPLVGRPIEFLVGANGQTLLLQDGERLWQSVADGMLVAAAAAGAGAGGSDARRVGALLTALPLSEREALLGADIRQILRFAGRDWSTEFVHAPATANYDCGLLMLTERSSAARPDTPIVHQRQWQVDARSGLVRMQIDEQWLRNDNNSAPVRAMRTQRTLTAE